MVNLVDIMRNLVGRITQLQVESIALPRVFLCNTLNIKVGDVVTDENGLEYTVTAIDINKWVEVEPLPSHGTPFAGPVLNAKPITFLHGTPKSTSEEYLEVATDTIDKTPFAWVLETYNYDTESRDSALAADFDVRMFFMAEADEEEWDNDEHNNLAIKPMENLAIGLENVINNDFSFAAFAGMNIKVRSRFGVYITDKGNEAKIIEEDLSGVELRFRLRAYDLDSCTC